MTTDPHVLRAEAFEDLQHALIIHDEALREDAERRIREAERLIAEARFGRRWDRMVPSDRHCEVESV